ncbi:MAG: hypothetical protein R3F19_10050 [Verrucomicrobiales bacterium]
MCTFSRAQDGPSLEARETAATKLANSAVDVLQELPDSFWQSGLGDESEVVAINTAHALAKLQRPTLSLEIINCLGKLVSSPGYATRTQALGVLVNLEDNPGEPIVGAVVTVAIAKQWRASDLAVKVLERWQPALDVYADCIIASAMRSDQYSDRERGANLLPLLKLADRGFSETNRTLVTLLGNPGAPHQEITGATDLIKQIGPAAAPVASSLARRILSTDSRSSKVAMVHAMKALKFPRIPDALEGVLSAEISQQTLDPVDIAFIAETGYNDRSFWPEWRRSIEDVEFLVALCDYQLAEGFFDQMDSRGVSIEPSVNLVRRRLDGTESEIGDATRIARALGIRAGVLAPDVWKQYRSTLRSTDDKFAPHRMIELLWLQPIAESVIEVILADVRTFCTAPDFGKDFTGESAAELASVISKHLAEVVRPVLDSPDLDRRVRAVHLIWAIAQWSQTEKPRGEIVDLFTVALSDSDPAVRLCALRGLQALQIEGNISHELFVKLLKDREEPLHEFAITQLLSIPLSGDMETFDWVRLQTKASSATIQKLAWQKMREFGKTMPLKVIEAVTEERPMENDYRVIHARLSALQLCQAESDRAVIAFTGFLSSEYSCVVVSAISNLKWFEADATESAIAHLESSNQEIRRAALDLLTQQAARPGAVAAIKKLQVAAEQKHWGTYDRDTIERLIARIEQLHEVKGEP